MDFSKEKETDNETGKLCIVKTAHLLLLSNINATDTSKEDYPPSSDIAHLEFRIPATLHHITQHIALQ